MDKRYLSFILVLCMLLLNACSGSVSDKDTTQQIVRIENPPKSLTKVKVNTDGMLSNFSYEYNDPFGIGNDVLVDLNYYDKNKISRGDIVLFKTKNNPNQKTDIARIVGLPLETVNIIKGQVYINEKKLDVFYGEETGSKNADSMKSPLTLKANEYFILADYRSRGFNDGFNGSQKAKAFSKEEILGKIVGY